MISTMFSIPLVRYSLSDWDSKKRFLMSTLESRQLTMGSERVWSDYADKSSENLLLSTITGTLRDELDQFAQDFRCEPSIVRAWFEKAYQNNHHPVHNHGHGGWSAVLYLDYAPDEHTPTIFVSPFDHFITGEQLTYVPDVKEGDLILFPSFLHHYTQPNESEIPRAVLSFNLTVDEHNTPLAWESKVDSRRPGLPRDLLPYW